MSELWFDDLTQLPAHCQDLRSFQNLLEARSVACRTNSFLHGNLHSYVIGGMWLLDSFGQISRIVYKDSLGNPFLYDSARKISVYPLAVFRELVQTSWYSTFNMYNTSPAPPDVPCVKCGKHWTMVDSNDVEYHDSYDKAQEIHCRSYYHPTCYVKDLAATTRSKFTLCLEQAGYKVLGSVQVTNEYGSLSYRGPWFLFDTDRGTFLLGWRKRVIICEHYATLFSMREPTPPTRVFEHTNDYTELSLGLTNYYLSMGG